MKVQTPPVDRVWEPGSLQGTDALPEAIAAKDLNNLYRTSCYFADSERYRAFCALYAVMRVVDDRIDAFLVRSQTVEEEKQQEVSIVVAWHRAVSACLNGGTPAARDIARTKHPSAGELIRAFAEAIQRFPVPATLWDNFFVAMRQDLENARFATYDEFIEYSEGAAVAPTTVYLYLIAADQHDGDGTYRSPRGFDLIQCGQRLGLFAYISHILRDFPKDLTAGERALLYLAADDMATHGLTEPMFFADLEAGSARPELRALVRDLVERAHTFAAQGRSDLQVLEEALSPDRAFILESIIRAYEEVLERIVSSSYDPLVARHSSMAFLFPSASNRTTPS